jgi:predicted SAM-dependent methyltransferase
LHALLARIRSGPLRASAPARPPGRKERVLASIDRAGKGLEIGPSHDPIAPKREGFDVQVIDHASREELRRKYAGHAVDLERIEEVDFVWKGETYLELTGRPKDYDWIIASHVIEHTPDLIAFLADCDAVLKDTGVLSLVIPDKRYSFDRFRPVTGLAAVLEANESGNRKPSAGAIAEAYMNAASKAHQLAWSEDTPGDYYFIHSAHVAREKVKAALEGSAYDDVHTWCFVPHSFRLLMHDLFVLGRTPLREVSFHATEGSEFYVTLGRRGAGTGMSRMELLRAVDAELYPPDAS